MEDKKIISLPKMQERIYISRAKLHVLHLLAGAQDRLMGGVLGDGVLEILGDVILELRNIENSLEDWRYNNEDKR